ncbi:MAG: hypothetical protein LAO78_04635 [Acidobacteriia bacterium]|nr:hypothetical protein [Terriglobia bacterium]
MSACAKFLAMVLVLGFGGSSAVTASHPVPKDRAALTNRDWLPHVVSKIAPLEWWSVASSSSDLRREDFPSDFEYELARADTSFPRFCFSLFRPKPQQMDSLIAAVSAYKSDVNWVMEDDCIVAMPAMPDFTTPPITPDEQEKLQAMLYKVTHPDAEFVKRALADAAKLAAYIEDRLNLSGKPSLDFNPQWLTREGLAASRGQFEDYWEPGSWTVFLARKPQEYAGKSEPTSARDRPLAMGIVGYEIDALFNELSPGWEAFQGEGPVIPAYPLLSRFSDMAADALYEPQEVDSLLNECLQTQARVKDPQAIRVLDNMIRIARWAQKLKVGIYFGAPAP